MPSTTGCSWPIPTTIGSVFDATSITDGESALFVLGQPDFATFNNYASQATFNDPIGLSADITGRRLFVADDNNSRIMVFDTSSLASGMNASSQIGQNDWSQTDGTLGQVRPTDPQSVTFNPPSSQVIVSGSAVNRVMFYDYPSSGSTFTSRPSHPSPDRASA